NVVTSSVLTGYVTELDGGTLKRMWTTKLAPVTRYVAISVWPHYPIWRSRTVALRGTVSSVVCPATKVSPRRTTTSFGVMALTMPWAREEPLRAPSGANTRIRFEFNPGTAT